MARATYKRHATAGHVALGIPAFCCSWRLDPNAPISRSAQALVFAIAVATLLHVRFGEGRYVARMHSGTSLTG